MVTPVGAARAAELVAAANDEHRRGNWQQARRLLADARRMDPYCVAGIPLEARIARDRGERAACALALQQMATLFPNSAPQQYAIGIELLQLGQVRPGLLALERAVQLAPRQPVLARELAAAYVSLQILPVAEMVLADAIRENPLDSQLPVSLARLFEAETTWDAAEYYYSLALRHRPEDLTLVRQRGRCRYRLGRFDDACIDLARCAAELQGEELSVAMLEFGDAALKTGRSAEAERIFAALSRHTGRNWDHRQWLNGLAALQGRPAIPANAEQILMTAAAGWHPRSATPWLTAPTRPLIP